MSKAKEISALWSQIKPQIGELVRLCHEVESHYEVTADAYQRGYENGYQCGLNDAWECVDKIFDLPCKRREQIFSKCDSVGVWEILRQYPASEAIEKIRQYEQRQEEQIQVGDEVIPRETEYDTMIVTRLWKDDYDSDCIDAIGFDGRISSFLVSRVSKTGKHHEIADVLQKMKESENG